MTLENTAIINCGKSVQIGEQFLSCMLKPGHEGGCATTCTYQSKTRDTYGNRLPHCGKIEARKPYPGHPYGATCAEHYEIAKLERNAKAIMQAQLFRVLASQIEATGEPIKIPHELKNTFASLVAGIYSDE